MARAAMPSCCMDCFILSYAATCDPADVFATQQEMNTMNWYCSDV